jgi:hypothetical protein
MFNKGNGGGGTTGGLAIPNIGRTIIRIEISPAAIICVLLFFSMLIIPMVYFLRYSKSSCFGMRTQNKCGIDARPNVRKNHLFQTMLHGSTSLYSITHDDRLFCFRSRRLRRPNSLRTARHTFGMLLLHNLLCFYPVGKIIPLGKSALFIKFISDTRYLIQ